MTRTYRAGDSVEDYCRACKTDRMHTVIVTDANSQPLRVVCGYCDSEHNFRGGPRIGADERPLRPSGSTRGLAPGAVKNDREPFPIVSERERVATAMTVQSANGEIDLEMLLRRVIREETGITAVTPAEKWRGGTFILRPGNPQLQEKTWPIETFFHKVVMLRNRLRTLEQQVNASDLPEDMKVKLQGYVSGCYGSLTSFNVLFAEEDDQFRGSSGE